MIGNLAVQQPDPYRAAVRLALEATDRSGVADPLRRLFDPTFTETVWEYDHSRVEPEIPGNLHEKQLEVLEADVRHRWLFWGNQVGKTTIGAVDVALLALGRHPYLQYWAPPLRMWASALTWDLWETIILPELLTWLPPDRVIDAPEPYVSSKKRRIRIRADNGYESWILGKSAEQGPEKYQSARVHVAWLDEEHPEVIWDEMQPRLVRYGGITIATMTPLKGFTWVYRRIYEPWRRGEAPEHFCCHAGLADNPAIGEEEIAALAKSLEHDPAQLAARLYGRFATPTGLALRVDPNRHYETLDRDAIETHLERGFPFGGVDFGAWRFAFHLCVADRVGRVHVVEEIFSQRGGATKVGETLDERAEAIHERLAGYKIDPKVPIWGDVANTQQIIEINQAFRRVAKSKGALKPYQVMPVPAENKARATSVERLNAMLGRDALLFRRDLGANQRWRYGQDASHEGRPTVGSRLLWEMGAWAYPEAKEGKAQKQDPDDDSADGADCIAALRYAVMSWWTASKYELPAITPSDPRYKKHMIEQSKRIDPIRPSKKKRRIVHPEFGEIY